MSQPLSFPWPTWTVFGERAEPVSLGKPPVSSALGKAGVKSGQQGGYGIYDRVVWAPWIQSLCLISIAVGYVGGFWALRWASQISSPPSAMGAGRGLKRSIIDSRWRQLGLELRVRCHLMPVILATQKARDEEDCSSKPARTNSSWKPILKKSTTKRRAGGVAQGAGHEFKPQYYTYTHKSPHCKNNSVMVRNII
jgi:hypothetical protein